jgi:hypothetical protein
MAKYFNPPFACLTLEKKLSMLQALHTILKKRKEKKCPNLWALEEPYQPLPALVWGQNVRSLQEKSPEVDIHDPWNQWWPALTSTYLQEEGGGTFRYVLTEDLLLSQPCYKPWKTNSLRLLISDWEVPGPIRTDLNVSTVVIEEIEESDKEVDGAPKKDEKQDDEKDYEVKKEDEEKGDSNALLRSLWENHSPWWVEDNRQAASSDQWSSDDGLLRSPWTNSLSGWVEDNRQAASWEKQDDKNEDEVRKEDEEKVDSNALLRRPWKNYSSWWVEDNRQAASSDQRSSDYGLLRTPWTNSSAGWVEDNRQAASWEKQDDKNEDKVRKEDEEKVDSNALLRRPWKNYSSWWVEDNRQAASSDQWSSDDGWSGWQRGNCNTTALLQSPSSSLWREWQ